MADCIPNYKDAVWSYYRYEPSIAGAVIFCILFGITSGLHAFQLYTTRTWYLSALVVGGLCEFPSSDERSVHPVSRVSLIGQSVSRRMHRIHSSRGQRNGRARLLEPRGLYRAERPDSYRARLHGCFDLHGPRKDHFAYRWGLALADQAAIYHKDLRGRRRDLTADAVLGYVYIRATCGFKIHMKTKH